MDLPSTSHQRAERGTGFVRVQATNPNGKREAKRDLFVELADFCPLGRYQRLQMASH